MRSSRAAAGVLILSLGLVACETLAPHGAGYVFDPSEEGIVREIASVKGPRLDESGYMYDPEDQSCDGYPRLNVETMPGTCLGLVMPKDRAADPVAKRSFAMPRTLVQVPGTKDFLITDMVAWPPYAKNKGSIFRMSKDAKGIYRLTLLNGTLNYPHAVKLGPDGKLWVGELNQISRFDIVNGKIANWQVMVKDLPAVPSDSHPLTNFAFDPRNADLYINSGSPSDSCEESAPAPCPAIEKDGKSAILKVLASDLANAPTGGVSKWTRVALGLRNSMALVIHSSGTLVQGENSRDFGSVSEPYEEINTIHLPAAGSPPVFRYGWPYCYNFGATSPEWTDTSPLKCGAGVAAVKDGDYQEPYILIPAHAAPLAADYYQGNLFSQLKGKLLMAWHGYSPTGHRLVAYDIDSQGRPALGANNASATYNFDRGLACPSKKQMKPLAGLHRYAPYSELITKWNAKEKKRPTGAPSGFTVADDGSIFITEDKNQTIVRLAKDSKPFAQEDCDPDWDERIEQLAWRRAVVEDSTLEADYQEIRTKLISTYCSSCHGGGVDKSVADDDYSTLDFLTKTTWFVPQKPKKSRALGALTHFGSVPAMPPPGSKQLSGPAEVDQIAKVMNDYIMRLPTDVSSRYGKTTLKSSRNIRSKPNSSSTICGSLPTGSKVYIDPRPGTFVKAGGWMWARVYLTSDHAALAGKTCAWPGDGVFYIATTQVK